MMGFVTDSGLLRLIPDETMDFAFSSQYLTDAEKEQYKAIMYSCRGSKTMIHEAEWCKHNMETISQEPAPTVPMLFFISKRSAKLIFPSDPEKYMSLSRNYTDNKAEYIDLECGHYVHVEEPGYIASEIRRFAGISE